MMRATAVILNDTRGDMHFGCERVMSAIERRLAFRGITVIATSLLRNNWESDAGFLDSLKKSDLVIVNGEGTLHDGARYGERLLRVAVHPACKGKQLALINALYQDNPLSWGEYLSRFDLLAARDEASRAEIERACSKTALLCPDLSLADGFIPRPVADTERRFLTIGDSVKRETTASLRLLGNNIPESRYLSILSQLKNPKSHSPLPLRMIRQVYSRVYDRFARLNNRLIIPKNQDDFITWLYRSRIHVTGRFHGVCLCLATETPFLAVKSNSRKIESLLDFCDLGRDRLVDVETAMTLLNKGQSLGFSEREKRKIRDGLKVAKSSADDLFDAIANCLVEAGR